MHAATLSRKRKQVREELAPLSITRIHELLTQCAMERVILFGNEPVSRAQLVEAVVDLKVPTEAMQRGYEQTSPATPGQIDIDGRETE